MKKVWDGALVLVCFRAALVQNWIGKGAVIICAGIGRKLISIAAATQSWNNASHINWFHLFSRPKLTRSQDQKSSQNRFPKHLTIVSVL